MTLHLRNGFSKKAQHLDWMESYRESSVNFSTEVSCGIIGGSNEGTHDSQ